MEELIRELYIFRNQSHELWFYLSMGSMLISLLGYAFLKSRIGIICFGLNHLQTSITAIVIVKILEKKSEKYSVDCIWFNALLFLIYASFFLLLSLKKEKTII
ncbi:hypothetical protein ACFL08_02125 [Patescibacteria group bacterium]